MKRLQCRLRVAVACVFAMTMNPLAAYAFSFDDFDYWIGAGANRAALVIDWTENSTESPALAWGYRWDGAATGADMLSAIVAADDRLFAKLGGTPASPVAVYGLGYDADGDGQLALDDETVFDAGGIAFSGPADGAIAIDADDDYAEGWFTGFWHYGIAPTNPYEGGSWSDVPLGMAGRVLADGSWDSWAFTPTFDFAAFAENPVAAMPPDVGPPLDLPGDFDGNNRVDAADYQVWKSAFGSVSDLAADANGSGVVDAADYTIWRDHFGAGTRALAASGNALPEPPTSEIALCSLGVLLFLARRKEKFL